MTPRALWRRCWPTAYLGLCAYDIVAAWLTRWPGDAKVNFTILVPGLAMWFVLWRVERRRRELAERVARRLGTLDPGPCDICHHYACNGGECLSCDGNCTSQPATRSVEYPPYWLN